MATAKEKRIRAVQLAIQWAKMPIVEAGGDNKGPLLDQYLKANWSGWSPGFSWCASFCSALGGAVDKEMGTSITGPAFKTNGSCSWSGQNRVSASSPAIGTVIMWRNNYTGAGTGHAGFVTEVKSDGSLIVAEGNTSGDPSVNRNGGQTAVKFKNYKGTSWQTINTKSGTRTCIGFGLLWVEKTDSLQSGISSEAQAKIKAAQNAPNPPSSDSSSSNSGSGSSNSEKKEYSAADFGIDPEKLKSLPKSVDDFNPTTPISTNSAKSKAKNNFDHELKVHTQPNLGIAENSKFDINDPVEL